MAFYLGIDPGLATIGFAVIEKKQQVLRVVDYGVIKTPKEASLQDRLQLIFDDFDSLLREIKPKAAAIEELFFVKNVTNGLKVAHARGILMERLSRHKIPVLELKPSEVKSQLTGYGAADKKMVQTMLQRLFKLKTLPKPDDAADALGLAYCASFHFL